MPLANFLKERTYILRAEQFKRIKIQCGVWIYLYLSQDKQKIIHSLVDLHFQITSLSAVESKCANKAFLHGFSAIEAFCLN